jgi:chemotaxis methyl-accepting protein methylase
VNERTAVTDTRVEPFYRPTLSQERMEKNLSGLLALGTIRDRSLDASIKRLETRFQTYCDLYPHGLWTPGLVVRDEMRSLTEQYLPIEEIRSAFSRLFSPALRHPESNGPTQFRNASNWLDLRQLLGLPEKTMSPAALLTKLAKDESCRIRFLFSLLLPRRHGERFRRYPGQIDFLRTWIERKKGSPSHSIRCLDSACGTGEGTYDTAKLLMECGVPPHGQRIHGCSLEHLEIFAAAHCRFPHDREREERFRITTKPLFDAGVTKRMLFFRDNVLRYPGRNEKPYDIILCNGLVGGPLLQGEETMTRAIAALAKRLRPGGILLAADRFHDGWKKANPPSLIEEIIKQRRLILHPVSEGLAAEKI